MRAPTCISETILAIRPYRPGCTAHHDQSSQQAGFNSYNTPDRSGCEGKKLTTQVLEQPLPIGTHLLKYKDHYVHPGWSSQLLRQHTSGTPLFSILRKTCAKWKNKIMSKWCRSTTSTTSIPLYLTCHRKQSYIPIMHPHSWPLSRKSHEPCLRHLSSSCSYPRGYVSMGNVETSQKSPAWAESQE